MKIECVKEDLLQALVITEKIAGTNPTLPILNCVLLEAEKDVLRVRSTNLELGIEVVVPIKKEQDGVVAVPASILYNTLQNTSDSHIILATKDSNLILTTKHSTTTISTHSPEDFPILPHTSSGATYTMKSYELMLGIQSVIYSASNSTIKPELSSVYIFEHDKKLFFVSTDSFRLAEKIIATKQKETLPQPLLLPIRNALEVVRILNQAHKDADITVTITENQCSLKFDSVFVTSRLIEGVFPDYQQIIPTRHTTEAVVLKQDLLNVFKKMNIFSDKFGQVSLYIDPKKKLFTVSARNLVVGETADSIDAAISGEKVEMNFNYRYIFDSLSSIHSDSITLFFSGIGKPLVIRGVSDDSFLYLVMPMNK